MDPLFNDNDGQVVKESACVTVLLDGGPRENAFQILSEIEKLFCTDCPLYLHRTIFEMRPITSKMEQSDSA